MSIANKIAFLVSLLLMGMAINNMAGLHQLSKVKAELQRVTQQDILLTEAITMLNQRQLKKAILFERLLRIAEELAFEDVVKARQIHLIDHLNVTQKGFNKLAQEGAHAIMDARKILKNAIAYPSDFMPLQELQRASDRLKSIEEAHIRYDKNVYTITENVKKKSKEISFQELTRLRKEEKRLTRETEDLLQQVQAFTHLSVRASEEAQDLARRILLFSLYASIFLGVVIAFWIIRGIANPLSVLVGATKKIGKGDLNVRIKKRNNDEIGQLSEAFNLMAEQLSEAKTELEQKNLALSESLELTNQQKQDLEKVNRELDSFVATVSHDIRAPLTGISGYSTILKKQYYDTLDKRGQRSIEGIQKGADRMNAMLRDLLELTKVSRTRNPYSKVDMNDIVDEVCDRLEYKIEKNQVQMTIADDLPTVTCDKIKMGVVFFNLINNAIKFSPEGRRPEIEIGYQHKGEHHQFFVKDNGIGIEEEDQKSIFEMFKRASTAQGYEGTGAGLNFVKEIIEEHCGLIWVESQVNQGSKFVFTISVHLT